MLEKYTDLEYIPSLHSNTSSLEAHFSLMLCYGADTPSIYESTLNIVDNEKSMKILKSNPMYDPHEERYIQSKSLTGYKGREKKLMVSHCETEGISESFVDTFDVWANEENFKHCRDIWPEMKKWVIFSSYKETFITLYKSP